MEEYEKVFKAAEGVYTRGAIGIFKNNRTGSVSLFAMPSKAFIGRIKEGKYVLLVRDGEAFAPNGGPRIASGAESLSPSSPDGSPEPFSSGGSPEPGCDPGAKSLSSQPVSSSIVEHGPLSV